MNKTILNTKESSSHKSNDSWHLKVPYTCTSQWISWIQEEAFSLPGWKYRFTHGTAVRNGYISQGYDRQRDNNICNLWSHGPAPGMYVCTMSEFTRSVLLLRLSWKWIGRGVKMIKIVKSCTKSVNRPTRCSLLMTGLTPCLTKC